MEGILTAGRLQTLANFDKPDPLDGPFFEETIYLTPSREPPEAQERYGAAAQRAVRALGLSDGPVHAEMRVNDAGRLDAGGGRQAHRRPVLPRPAIRVLVGSLEELLLQHALGEDIRTARLAPGAHGVMMIPIPGAGIYSGVAGVEEALETADIEAVEITAKQGQTLEPLPEGQSYLGFIFARAGSRQAVERALRRAHARLKFRLSQALPVVK